MNPALQGNAKKWQDKNEMKGVSYSGGCGKKSACVIILWKRCKALSEFPRFPDGPDDKVSGNLISSLSWLYKGNSYMHCLGVTELPKQCHIWCSDLALPMR